MARITKSEAWECRVQLPLPLELGNLHIVSRDYTILRVADENGAEGVAWGYSRGADIASTLKKNFFPLLKTHEVDAEGNPWPQLFRANQYVNQGGIYLRALSLVDIAIWDLKAAREGKSLAAVLGAKPLQGNVSAAACYPVHGKTLRDDAIEAKELVRRGYRSIKLCSADGGAGDTRRLQAIRETVGDDIELKVDVHWLWSSLADAKPVLREWEKLKIAWIEDAFSLEAVQDLRALKQSTSIPIAYGDEQNGCVTHRYLIESGGLDVLRLDATVVGGITEFLRVGKAANAAGIVISGHIFEEYHTAALGKLTKTTNIERFEPDSGLDAIDQLREMVDGRCRWNWDAVERNRIR
jgi:D-arabinonate dehydratase